MDQKQKARWERTREKGKWRTVLLVGLPQGVFMGLAFPFGWNLLLDDPFPLWLALVMAPLWLLAGLNFGLVWWHLAERHYHEGE